MTEEPLELTIRKLDSPDAAERRVAIAALVPLGRGSHLVARALLRAAVHGNGGDDDLLRAIHELRAEIRALIPGLVTELKDPCQETREEGARLLSFALFCGGGDLKAERPTLDALLNALHDPSEEVRREVCLSLREFAAAGEEHAAVPALVRQLADPSLRVRKAVLGALMKLGPPAVARIGGGGRDVLVDLFADPDHFIHRTALGIVLGSGRGNGNLMEATNPRVRGALLRFLGEGKIKCITAALEACEGIPEFAPEERLALQNLKSHENANVRAYAHLHLTRHS